MKVNPMLSFEGQIKDAKEREAYLSFEFYRLLTDAISKGLVYEDTKCKFKEVIPEFPVDAKRADLVVFATKYGGKVQPFLVVEVKMRAYERPGPSIRTALKRALSYAKELDATFTPFFAVYDGWELLVFRNITPYLIGAYAAIKDEYQARHLLLGLEEFSYKDKGDLLNKLPKHADPDFLLKRVMPSIAKDFTRDSSEMETLLKSWRRRLLG